MVKILQCLKTPQICYLRHAELHAKNRTSLRHVVQIIVHFFLNNPLFEKHRARPTVPRPGRAGPQPCSCNADTDGSDKETAAVMCNNIDSLGQTRLTSNIVSSYNHHEGEASFAGRSIMLYHVPVNFFLYSVLKIFFSDQILVFFRRAGASTAPEPVSTAGANNTGLKKKTRPYTTQSHGKSHFQ